MLACRLLFCVKRRLGSPLGVRTPIAFEFGLWPLFTPFRTSTEDSRCVQVPLNPLIRLIILLIFLQQFLFTLHTRRAWEA